jgi:hypothetical protein
LIDQPAPSSGRSRTASASKKKRSTSNADKKKSSSGSGSGSGSGGGDEATTTTSADGAADKNDHHDDKDADDVDADATEKEEGEKKKDADGDDEEKEDDDGVDVVVAFPEAAVYNDTARHIHDLAEWRHRCQLKAHDMLCEMKLEVGCLYLPSPTGSGILVTGVGPGKPADVAGIQERDVLLHVAGRPVCDRASFAAALHGHRPLDRVPILLKRHRKGLTLTLTLGARGYDDMTEVAAIIRLANYNADDFTLSSLALQPPIFTPDGDQTRSHVQNPFDNDVVHVDPFAGKRVSDYDDDDQMKKQMTSHVDNGAGSVVDVAGNNNHNNNHNNHNNYNDDDDNDDLPSNHPLKHSQSAPPPV